MSHHQVSASPEGPIPLIASRWIVSVLSKEENLIQHMSNYGMGTLTVRELKQIQSRLARIGQTLVAQNTTSQAPSSSQIVISAESINRGVQSLPSSAKKSRHLARVRSFFFIDAACTVYHQALLNELTKESQEGSSSGTASASSAAHTPQQQISTTAASASAMRNSNHGSSSSRKRPLPSSSAPTPAPVLQFPPHHFPQQSFGFPPGFMPPNNFMNNSYAAQFPQSFHSAAARSRAQSEVARFSEFIAAHQGNSSISSHTPNGTSNSENHASSRHSAGSQTTQPSSASNQPRSFASSESTATGNAAGPAFAAFAASVLANSNNSDGNGNDGPRTPEEVKLFLELTQMGFQDQGEVLNAIRHFTENSNDDSAADSGGSSATGAGANLTSEQVMLWIISQREEAEEARKMDLARFQSEELRKEQAERRKQEKESRIGSASLDVLAQTMFPKSWILKRMSVASADNGDSNRGSIYSLVAEVVERAMKDSKDEITEASVELKKALIQLLELEKNALKWYNCLVPRAYFENWCQDVMDRYICHPDAPTQATTPDSAPSSVLMSWMKQELEKEITKLETAMYSRPSEDETVPKIFTKAHEEALRQSSGEAYGASDDDDVIIILDSSSESSSPSNNDPSNDRK